LSKQRLKPVAAAAAAAEVLFSILFFTVVQLK